MAGSLKWNLILGISGFFILFLSAWTANEWQTSLMRGTYGFFLLFIAAFVIRFVWGMVATTLPDKPSTPPLSTPSEHHNDTKEQDPKQMADVIRSFVQEDQQPNKNEQ